MGFAFAIPLTIEQTITHTHTREAYLSGMTCAFSSSSREQIAQALSTQVQTTDQQAASTDILVTQEGQKEFKVCNENVNDHINK